MGELPVTKNSFGVTLGMSTQAPTFKLSSTDTKTDHGTWPVVCLEDGVPIPGVAQEFPSREKARKFARTYDHVHGGGMRSLLSLTGVLGIEKTRETIRKLAPTEARVVLALLSGGSQTQVATATGLSQPSVCHYVSTATRRIKFLVTRESYDIVKVREYLEGLIGETSYPGHHYLDIPIAIMFIETMCQSTVADRLGVTQGFVRHRILRMMDFLKPHRNKASLECLGLLRNTMANLNALGVNRVEDRVTHQS